MKSTLVIFFVFLSIGLFSQTKDEKIENLKNKKAALEILLESEKALNSQKSAENQLLTNEIAVLKQEMKEKKFTINSLSDSITALKKSPNNSSEVAIQTLPIKKAMYLKKPTIKSNDIQDYLDQFKLIQSYEYVGKQQGNPSHDATTGEDPYAKYTQGYDIYEKGIVLWTFLEHEGARYQLFIPMLSVYEAKSLVLNLCENMGGCLAPDEVTVTFTEGNGGVFVSWGGGC
jgi:hypothetical protein